MVMKSMSIMVLVRSFIDVWSFGLMMVLCSVMMCVLKFVFEVGKVCFRWVVMVLRLFLLVV